MNEQIKQLAEQSGFAVYGWNENEFEKFANLVAAHEREACAKVAEAWDKENKLSNYGAFIAFQIRARGVHTCTPPQKSNA